MTDAAANATTSRTGMLIRRPVGEVFAAFVDPQVTTRFWFTHASGPLREDAEVEWRWEMYDVRTTAKVLAFEQDRRLGVEWRGDEGPTRVEWRFDPKGDRSTFVEITHDGFAGDLAARAAQARESTEGFALVLAGLKALLEHGIELNLVADRFPPSE